EKNQSVASSSTTKKDEVRGVKIRVKPNLISEKEEYDTKAVYIYNFISYIFWPNETLGESFNIGIVGDSPIKTYLQTRANGRDVNNVPITVEAYNPKKTYHILFFSKAGQADFNKIRKSLNSKTVLLITENSLFENIGSHLTLFVDGKKVKYTANKNELEKSKLKVNSSLYRLSE
ncbi:MAG: YfiR family protein, partial [Bacteroidia bacterium]